MENQALGAMIGHNGDYAINAGDTVTTQKFSHILITSDAVIDDIKLLNVSCKSARNYGSTLNTGYLICAPKGQYFDYIKLTSGAVEGVLYFNESDI
jgi:hypothetical protein